MDIERVQLNLHLINYEDKRLICFSFGARDLSYRPVTTSSAQTRIIEKSPGRGPRPSRRCPGQPALSWPETSWAISRGDVACRPVPLCRQTTVS